SEHPQSGVALGAKQAAHPPSFVLVVNHETAPSRSPSTNRTATALSRYHATKLLFGQLVASVPRFENGCPSSLIPCNGVAVGKLVQELAVFRFPLSEEKDGDLHAFP